MGKIIFNMAISLDGYIADEQGGFEWIKGDGDTSHNTINTFDFNRFVEEVDTIVMGRSAYEDCGIKDIPNFQNKNFLIASKKKFTTESNVKIISQDICELVVDLKEKEGKTIWIFGGAVLAQEFINRKLIDEYIIGIIPVILGQGKGLFDHVKVHTELHLQETSVQEGIVIMSYIPR